MDPGKRIECTLAFKLFLGTKLSVFYLGAGVLAVAVFGYFKARFLERNSPFKCLLRLCYHSFKTMCHMKLWSKL